MSDLIKLDKIAKRGGDIKLASLQTNFKRAQIGKNEFGEVTIAVDNETVILIGNGQAIGGLYVTTIQEWNDEKNNSKSIDMRTIEEIQEEIERLRIEIEQCAGAARSSLAGRMWALKWVLNTEGEE